MIERPRFKEHLAIEIVSGEGVFLLSELGHSILTGRLFELVAGIAGARLWD